VAHRRPRACLALARKRTGIRASAAYDQAAYELRARNVQRNTWLCSSMNRRIQSANPLRSRRRRGGLPHCARCRSQRAFRGPPGSRARTRSRRTSPGVHIRRRRPAVQPERWLTGHRERVCCWCSSGDDVVVRLQGSGWAGFESASTSSGSWCIRRYWPGVMPYSRRN
jgi:hypothetical protein